VPCENDLDPQFHKLVTERITAGNPERKDSPTYLLKRLKQFEQENAALRQKKSSRPEDAAAELKELVTELKHQSCAAEFPAQSAAALERISLRSGKTDTHCLVLPEHDRLLISFSA
jgi:hypothetical protein